MLESAEIYWDRAVQIVISRHQVETRKCGYCWINIQKMNYR
jgi:hypothetical protein